MAQSNTAALHGRTQWIGFSGRVVLMTLNAALLALGGCASHPTPVITDGQAVHCTPDQSQKDDQHSQQPACWVLATPFASVGTGFWNPDQDYSNLYTRIMFLSRGTRDRELEKNKGTPPGPGNSYVYEYRDRGPLLRTLWGSHYSVNLTAYVTIGAYQATVPLVTIEHTSNRNDGERFVRVIYHSVQNFPLVLVRGDGSNAIASLRFVVKATDETQSNAAALAIQAAESVAKAVAPESAVVTTLSAPAAKDKATALDKAINSVMAKQLDEEQVVENDVRRWHHGVSITFRVPPPEHEKKWDDSSQFKNLGLWNVVFEYPRPSIFSDVQVCPPPEPELAASTDATTKDATVQGKSGRLGVFCLNTVPEAIDAAQHYTQSRPEQVLAFSLLDGTHSLGSVEAYLKQQSWWESSMKVFNGLAAGAEPKTDDVAGFCRSIKTTIATVGLNAVDGGIVVAAVRDRAQLPGGVVKKMTEVTECQYAQKSD